MKESDNIEEIGKKLLEERWFISISQTSTKIPDEPGVYAIRLANPRNLTDSFRKILFERPHKIIYIGIATKSLRRRLDQELWAKGHGTFFRTLGAVLGYTPPKGSLVGKSNQNNYKFSPKNEIEIIKWIEKNLIINWIELSENINKVEEGLIEKYYPLLNTTGNPLALQELRSLRQTCIEIAREKI